MRRRAYVCELLGDAEPLTIMNSYSRIHMQLSREHSNKKASKMCFRSGRTSSKRAQKEIPSQRERLPPSAEKKLPSWIDGKILARIETYPHIIVFLIRDCLLHQTAVEDIDFEQIKPKSFLRHVIK